MATIHKIDEAKPLEFSNYLGDHGALLDANLDL